jgi:hypothetical protein
MSRKSFINACIALGLSVVISLSFWIPAAYAGDRHYGYYPYGQSGRGYGQRKAVSNSQEARRLLKDHYSRRDVKIGDVRERELFFEADMRDRRGILVDKVIIDKRTGRIRSMY